MNKYLGALGFVCLFGFKILGTSLVRYSLMKQLPHGGLRQMTGDGYY